MQNEHNYFAYQLIDSKSISMSMVLISDFVAVTILHKKKIKITTTITATFVTFLTFSFKVIYELRQHILFIKILAIRIDNRSVINPRSLARWLLHQFSSAEFLLKWHYMCSNVHDMTLVISNQRTLSNFQFLDFKQICNQQSFFFILHQHFLKINKFVIVIVIISLK